MSKKPKKGAAITVKLTPKTNDDNLMVQELHLKKKLFEDKLNESVSRRNMAYSNLMEEKKKLREIQNFHINDDNKFSSIKADFINNSSLYKKNYTTKIDELKSIQQEKENIIQEMNTKLEEMRTQHESTIEQKNKMLQQIRTNMEDLSQYFSKQLEDIQKSLQCQIEKISSKWEFNITEHLKKYEDHVKKYDMTKDI